MLYRLYSLVVDSEEPLPGALCPAGTPADVRVDGRSARALSSSPQWFSRRRLPTGESWLSVAKVGEGYLLRFHELADFIVTRSGREVSCTPAPLTPPETLRHLLLDHVIPMIVNLSGREALHASAVLTSQGVIALVGPTGSGKSTLAGSFLVAGDPLLSDDCLALSEEGSSIRAIPAYPGLRLWRDARTWLFKEEGGGVAVAHYTTKQRVPIETSPRTYCAGPQALGRAYLLASSPDPETVKVETQHLGPREALVALIRSAFRLDTTDGAMLARQLRLLSRVVSKVPVRRLVFPRSLERLAIIRETILADLQDQPGSHPCREPA